MLGNTTRTSLFRLALIAGSALVAPGFACAQAAPPVQAGQAPQAAPSTLPAPAGSKLIEEIVVSGYTKSLDDSLKLKRANVGLVDGIFAEDIGKFPDNNLAESMQRLPGVDVTRDGGEGREITVRGLNGNFTVVNVNGMESSATSMNGGSGGTLGAGQNNSRAFDFNVFPSELFNSLIVHKTTDASLDEGSLGAVVELNTGHPLGGHRGFTAAFDIQGQYNDLSKNVGPKMSALFNYVNQDKTFGMNFAVAYSHTNTLELGNNSTGWAQQPYNSVTTNGVTTPCYKDTVNANGQITGVGSYIPSAVCNQAEAAYSVRIPRYGVVTHDRQRLGLTSSVEWAPSDRTTLEIDGLFSRYVEVRQEFWNEALVRNSDEYINLVNPVYNSAGNEILAATLTDNVYGIKNANNELIRDESYYQYQRDTFYQVNAKFEQKIGDHLTVKLYGGASRSDSAIPVAEDVILDDKNGSSYSYNYSNMMSPSITESNVTNASNFQLDELRNYPTDTVNTYKTGKIDLIWKANDSITIKLGAAYRDFGFSTSEQKLDDYVCAGNTGKPDAYLGTVTCNLSTYGYPATGLTQLTNLGNAGQPAGSVSQYLVANIAASNAYLGYNPWNPNANALWAFAPNSDPSADEQVNEKDLAAYLQLDARGSLFGVDYATNIGGRLVKTIEKVTGLVDGYASPTSTSETYISTTLGHSYVNFLPAFNFDLYPSHALTLRFAAAKTMARPQLSSLSPFGNVGSTAATVSFGNPDLTPYLSTNLDFDAEWYFAPKSLLSVGLFHKAVTNFPVSTTVNNTYQSTGLPASYLLPGSLAANVAANGGTFAITTATNGSGAEINGIEVGLQGPFSFLPGVLKHFGAILNATFDKATQPDNVEGPDTVNPTTGALVAPAAAYLSPAPTFFGLSKVSYNAVLYFDYHKFSGRVSLNYVGPYNYGNASYGNILYGSGSLTTVDASLRYTINSHAEITLDAQNLTDAYQYQFYDLSSQRNYNYSHFGRNLSFGARYKF